MDFNLFKAIGFSQNGKAAPDQQMIRGLGILAAIGMPLFSLIFPAEAWDPLWMRIAIGAYCLLTVILSYFSGWIYKNLSLLATFFLYLLTLWILYLLYRNQLGTVYVINYFMVVFLCNVFFDQLRMLIIYSFLNLVAATIFVNLVPDPLFSPAILLTYTLILSLVNVGRQSFYLYVRENLENNKRNFKIIAEAAFGSSRDAILAVDPEGYILGFNQVFLDMWDMSRDDLTQQGRRISQTEASHLISNMDDWKQLIRETWLDPKRDTQFEIHRTDGRILESYSKPFLKDGKVLGRIWYFIDVSEARNRESSLIKSRIQKGFQQEAMVKLVTSPELNSGNQEFAFEEIVKVAIEILKVDYAGIWLLDEEKKYSLCWKQISRESDEYHSGEKIDVGLNHIYFEAIARERVILISDLLREPGRKGLMKGHARDDSRAMIEVPVRLDGNLHGLLLLEQAKPRIWTEEESHFAESLADVVALSLKEAERARSERNLANSLALLKAIFDLSGVGILVNDLQNHLLSVNELFLIMWGLERETLNQFSGDELFQHNEAQLKIESRTPENVIELIENREMETPALLEFLDGRYVERFSRALLVEEKIAGRVWFFRDVTAMMEANLALISSEEKNKAILKAIPDLMIRVDRAGIILDHTTHSLLIPGLKGGEMTGSHLRNLGPAPHFSFDLVQKIRETYDSQTDKIFEGQVEVGEQVLELEARLVPSGKSDVLIMIRDITQRKIAERKLIQKNFELDSFVYRVSHDLAAPLSSLVGLVEILKGEVEDPQSLRYLGMMDTSILKLQTFIKNLTDFSRNERMELCPEEIDLEALIAESFEGLAHLDSSGRVERKITIEQNYPFASDPVRIGIVLTNLISNTFKYQNLERKDSWVQVQASIRPEYAEFTVTDNGLGIHEAHLERIFDLFFRASNQSFGSGLGLYITRNTIQKLDGEIRCESTVGKGTTFQVKVPNLAKGILGIAG